MKNFCIQACAGLLLATTGFAAFAQTPADNAVPVTADNFIRAESDLHFGGTVKDGGFGKFFHCREPKS